MKFTITICFRFRWKHTWSNIGNNCRLITPKSLEKVFILLLSLNHAIFSEILSFTYALWINVSFSIIAHGPWRSRLSYVYLFYLQFILQTIADLIIYVYCFMIFLYLYKLAHLLLYWNNLDKNLTSNLFHLWIFLQFIYFVIETKVWCLIYIN